MSQQPFYPALNTIIKTENLPEPFQSMLSKIIDKLFYRSLYCEKSNYGDIGYYNLTIVFKSSVGLNLSRGDNDDGFEILLNPGTTGLTELRMAMRYKWPILKYASKSRLSQLNSLEDYVDFVKDILQITDQNLLNQTVLAFHIEAADPITDFVATFNQNPEYTSNQLTTPTGEELYHKILHIYDQFQTKSIDVTTYVIDNYLLGEDLEDSIANLSDLFKEWIGSFYLEMITDMLIPKFSASLNNLQLALAFPRTWLKPLDANGDIIEGDVRSKLTYNVGTIGYNTDTGFDFQNTNTFVLDKSQIGDTGFTIEVTDVKLDFKTNSNIPEADADGRPTSFQGVFIETATIGLPVSWDDTTAAASGNTTITGTNLLIGSEGGFSGQLSMDSPVSGETIAFSAFGMDFALNTLSVAMYQNAVTAADLQGTVAIPMLAEDGQPAPVMNLTATWDGVKEYFKFTGTLSPSVSSTIGDFTFGLDSVSFGLTADSIQDFALNGTVAHAELLASGTSTPAVIDVDFTYASVQDGFEFALAAQSQTVSGVALKGLPITLESFGFTIDEGGIQKFDIDGTANIKDVEKNGDPAWTVGMKFSYDSGNWEMRAHDAAGVKLSVPGIVDFDLYTLGIGKENDDYFLRIGDNREDPALPGLNADIDLDIPFVSRFIPESIDIESLKINTGPGGINTEDEKLTIKWKGTSGKPIDGQLLNIDIPVNLSILNVLTIKKLNVGLAAGDSLSLFATADGSMELGALSGYVEGIGLQVNVAETANSGGAGDLGMFDFSGYEIIPPTGIGLSIDTGGMSGGGFLSFDDTKGQYAGVLDLWLWDSISLKAVGIIDTKMPDGSDGFSLIISIMAEFTPIQLGLGFSLDGVGGLLGLHRTMNLNALRDGVKDNSLDDILFPTDPIKNANRIIRSMGRAFPVKKDQFVMGLMGIIGWGDKIVSGEIGFIVEVARPVKLALLGVIRAILPRPELPLVRLQVNFLGYLDFGRKKMGFDASLYDSYFLSFKISGDMFFRMSWGKKPAFAYSVGGFHPDYNLPSFLQTNRPVRRIRLDFVDTSVLKIYAESYMAITSNSYQFGAKNELRASFGVRVHGWFHFDVLIQINPFFFSTQVDTGLSVKIFGINIASLRFRGKFQGPNRYHVNGSLKVSLFLFSKTFRLDESFGSSHREELPHIDILPLLEEALESNANWSVVNPNRSYEGVSLAQRDASILALSPEGKLVVNQKVLPLGQKIEKYHSGKPTTANARYNLKVDYESQPASESAYTYEEFALAQYKNYSNSEKLRMPSFSSERAGLSTTPSQGGLQFGNHRTSKTVAFDDTIRYHFDKTPEPVETFPREKALSTEGILTTQSAAVGQAGTIFKQMVGNSQAGLHASRIGTDNLSLRAQGKESELNKEAYVLANMSDLTAYVQPIPEEPNVFETEAEAIDYLEELLKFFPELKEELLVIPEYQCV